MEIYALHGFLGRPQDWTQLLSGQLSVKLHAADLFNGAPIGSIGEWAEDFCKQAAATEGPRVLMGYSLGGRLALHALLQRPQLWDAAIIISAHTGLQNAKDREHRRQTDELWAARFESDPWNLIIEDWNRREAFKCDTFHFDRREADYQRQTLAAVLRQWSLGLQRNLLPDVAKLELPICWMAGANDEACAAVARQVSLQHSLSKCLIIPEAGHRLPWQKPQEFLTGITDFLTGKD